MARGYSSRFIVPQDAEKQWLPVYRGSREWDLQEMRRRDMGCRCLSFGSIPRGLGFGERPSRYQRRMLDRLRF